MTLFGYTVALSIGTIIGTIATILYAMHTIINEDPING